MKLHQIYNMRYCGYLKERNSDCLPLAKKDSKNSSVIRKQKRKNTNIDKVQPLVHHPSKSILTPQAKVLKSTQVNSSSNPFLRSNHISPLNISMSKSNPSLPTLTFNDRKVIQEKVKTKVKLELKKLKSKIVNKINQMNKIGVIPKYANEVRGFSLMSIESSFMYKLFSEKKIPNLARIAKTDLLSKKVKLANGCPNSRSQLLDKMKSVLLKDRLVFSPVNSLHEFEVYSRSILDEVEKYRA